MCVCLIHALYEGCPENEGCFSKWIKLEENVVELFFYSSVVMWTTLQTRAITVS